jgi:hypothetical protein
MTLERSILVTFGAGWDTYRAYGPASREVATAAGATIRERDPATEFVVLDLENLASAPTDGPAGDDRYVLFAMAWGVRVDPVCHVFGDADGNPWHDPSAAMVAGGQVGNLARQVLALAEVPD